MWLLSLSKHHQLSVAPTSYTHSCMPCSYHLILRIPIVQFPQFGCQKLELKLKLSLGNGKSRGSTELEWEG